MTPATLLVYMVLNAALQWQFDSVVHLNGNGARAYCEDMQRWKVEIYRGKVGDLKVVCTDDKGERT
jgi:hypothetical protein